MGYIIREGGGYGSRGDRFATAREIPVYDHPARKSAIARLLGTLRRVDELGNAVLESPTLGTIAAGIGRATGDPVDFHGLPSNGADPGMPGADNGLPGAVRMHDTNANGVVQDDPRALMLRAMRAAAISRSMGDHAEPDADDFGGPDDGDADRFIPSVRDSSGRVSDTLPMPDDALRAAALRRMYHRRPM